MPDGTGIAFLYMPRLGSDYAWAIVQGTTDADLEKGPGHYVGTALPGQVGNFAVAGHRVGKGEPFLNLDHLQAGDTVIVQTESKWFVYRVKGMQHNNIDSTDSDGIPGREIVSPSDGDVLDAVPDHPSDADTDRAADDDDHLPSQVHRVAAHGHPCRAVEDLSGIRPDDAGAGQGALQHTGVLMYTWIWRHLPGHISLKLLEVLILFLAVTALLFFVIFPWIEPHLPINQVTVPEHR